MDEIPLFPLGRALFPDGVLHLRVFEVRYLDMIRRCIADGSEFGVVGLLEGREVRSPESVETLATAGTMARIDTWHAPMPALIHVRCIGTAPFELLSSRQEKYGLWVGRPAPLAPDPPTPLPASLKPSADVLGRLIANMQKEQMPAAAMPLAPPFKLDECGWVADRWAELLPLTALQRQNLLKMRDPRQRLERVQGYIRLHGLFDSQDP
ncbi:LON peptidase substrate-binding domain-containing protein [Pusillimonas sp.]|uniref:LON peptidase substrate-binding domain-containing protein n=1 Tax=Pusillimonas sp. TaxID=3040095 RepID=UPI0029A3A46F|nr:LON peptidase substrate-binding domain-containing protein [Pusillimonas sp.]MDX3893391.1 LON peptidase substrate-binding domain-containing protein [Pusillimonas sp.]